VPDAVLFKRGHLAPDEIALMRQHPIVGERLCAELRSLRGVAAIVRHHHERWNGSGYPDGLVGEAIPLLARVLSVADVFDALTTWRPYREPMPRIAALGELQYEAALGLWQPGWVEAFGDMVLTAAA
jgi:cyclic di-GMP phosphodiesterase